MTSAYRHEDEPPATRYRRRHECSANVREITIAFEPDRAQKEICARVATRVSDPRHIRRVSASVP
jgi:hypothetical protein